MSRILKIALLMSLAWIGIAPATAFEKNSGLPIISAAEMPKEGRDTLALIRKGGPFPYQKDGTTFSNRERVLPKEPRGYYREYTVKTPGSRDRGARRIICGGKPATICYYTTDHYQTFKLIRE